MKNYKTLLTVFTTLFCGIAFANNLQITGISRPAQDEIQFNISWDNSWYANSSPNNWDAVWIFVKMQDCNSIISPWEHADVSTTSADHSTSSPLQVDAVSDGKGVFIRRSGIGFGSIPSTTVTLKLQNNNIPLSNVNFEVMGIEMVAVLQGAFELGGTTGSYSSYTAGAYAFKNNYQVTSENQINAGDLLTDGSPVSTGQVGYNPDIPASFPKGYNQFYCMKYEISQEQYMRFLNRLNYAQQYYRTAFSPGSPVNSNAISDNIAGIRYRNGIKNTTVGNVGAPAIYGCDYGNNGVYDESNDGQNIACNFLNWTDLLAYLDWAALRPMTELEYEKACRGLDPTVTNEYAWGNSNITYANSGAISFSGQAGEVSTTNLPSGNGLVAMGSSGVGNGPLRVGFAANTNLPTRAAAGATYWGILDMTGNVWEQAVSVGYANGNISAFTGALGDGEVDAASGDANVAGWDLDPTYSIVRGGSWAVTNYYGWVGSRYYVNSTSYNLNRNYNTGGRGVRQF